MPAKLLSVQQAVERKSSDSKYYVLDTDLTPNMRHLGCSEHGGINGKGERSKARQSMSLCLKNTSINLFLTLV